MALEFLVRGAEQFDEPGVFVSFEETAAELTQNSASLGFNLRRLVSEKRILLDHVRVDAPELLEAGAYNLEGLFIRLDYAIKTVNARRVVIDTLEALFAGLPDQRVVRAELRRLLRWLKDRGITTVLTAEPLLDARGGLIGVTCASADITARKQPERELEAIAAISAALRSASIRAEMLPIILNQLLQLLHAEGALIETLLPASGELLVELGAGKWASATGWILPPGAGVSAQVVATGQPYLSEDVTQDIDLRFSDLIQNCRATTCGC